MQKIEENWLKEPFIFRKKGLFFAEDFWEIEVNLLGPTNVISWTLEEKILKVFFKFSMYTENSITELIAPCLTPLLTENLLDSAPFHFTTQV